MHVVCLVLVSLQRQLGDLTHNVNADISPLCTCRKIKNAFGVKEGKLPLMNQQCIVYNFSVVCVMQVMSDIHLHQHIQERKRLAVGNLRGKHPLLYV